jgi:MFS family permease
MANLQIRGADVADPGSGRPLGRSRIIEISICSIGGLVFGYDLGAISTVTQTVRSQFHLSPLLMGSTVSASLWGTVVGALVAGQVADRVGRRFLISNCALIYLLATLSVTAIGLHDWRLMILARALCGGAVGGITVGCPLYLAELAPSSMRGIVVSLFQLQVGIGVVLAFIVGRLLDGVVYTDSYWRWCLGLGVTFATILFVLFSRPLSPDRTRRLGFQKKSDKCAMMPLAQQNEALFQMKYLRPLLLASSVALFNQLTGVNILLLYVLDILASAGVYERLGHTYTIVISLMSLAATLLSMRVIDRMGRKPLLTLGAVGMSICLCGLATAVARHLEPVICLALLITYNCLFAMSQGTVVWVYLSELFPVGVRGAGQGFGTSVHWIANAILVFLFPLFRAANSSYVLYFLALMMVMQIVVIQMWYPETKQLPLGSLSMTPR